MKHTVRIKAHISLSWNSYCICNDIINKVAPSLLFLSFHVKSETTAFVARVLQRKKEEVTGSVFPDGFSNSKRCTIEKNITKVRNSICMKAVKAQRKANMPFHFMSPRRKKCTLMILRIQLLHVNRKTKLRDSNRTETWQIGQIFFGRKETSAVRAT